MSEYDTESMYGYEDEEKQRQLFRYDTSLIRSIQKINDWKSHTSLPYRNYLQKQVVSVTKQYNMFSCGSQIKAIAFCKALDLAFSQLIQKYKQTYFKVSQKSMLLQLKQLDVQLSQYVKYLHVAQSKNIINLYDQISQQEGVNSIYDSLRKLADYCLDLNTLWLLLLTPKMFSEQQKQNIYKVNYGGTLLYYQKQLLYLEQRIKRAKIHNFELKPVQDLQLVKNISTILSNQKLKQNLKTKIISLLKGQYYAMKSNKTVKQQFIIASLQMYYGEEVSELWDQQKYQDLCINVLKHSFKDDQYLQCVLFMKYQSISFENRKKTLEFAQIYYSIMYKVIHQQQQNEMVKQQNSDVKPLIQISNGYINKLMKQQNFQLICFVLINFLMSNKNSFSTKTPELDILLFGILDGLKKIYLSFGSQKWLAPNSALSSLTNRFFNKLSQDVKDQIVSLLPSMVKHLGEGSLPIRPKFRHYQHKTKDQQICKHRHASQPELLSAIFYYIKDAQYKDQDFYLDLPQVTPCSLQTFIMFIRSLELKLRHHEPTQEQKKLWIMMIDQSMSQFKIKVNLKWYKKKTILDIQQRQAQWNIQKQIKQPWAFQLLQDILNSRDQQIYQQLNRQENNQNKSLGQAINYFKYSLYLNLNEGNWSSTIQQSQIFMLLDRMRSLLQINFGNIFKLKPDQLVTLNQLHISLKFYNTKVQEAKGNQVYMLIVHKIIIPWCEHTNKDQSQKFKQKFPQFFQNYIIRQYYITIGDSIITLLAQNQDKENLVYKIKFYNQQLNSQNLNSNSIDINAEFLQKLCSVIDQNMPNKVLVALFLLMIKFFNFVPNLEEYVSLGYLIDYINSSEKLKDFLKQISDLAYNEKNKINFQLIKKLPQKISNLSFDLTFQILKNYIDSQQDNQKPEKLLKILCEISHDKENLFINILKALISERNKLKKIDSLSLQANAIKQQEDKAFGHWKELQTYMKNNLIERKPDEQQINLAKICQLFQQTVFKKLKQDYKKILQTDYKKKLSSKKSSGSSSDKKINEIQIKQGDQNKDVQPQDKFKEAKIWRKVVKNFGTFQDIILFGQDPLELMGAKQQQIFDKCLKLILQKTIQQKYLKRIIRKLPILQKCAEQAVQKILLLQKQGKEVIQPQFILKLIMINSRYRSKTVEDFILKNLSKVPIPLKIYQDYLVLDVKKKIQNLPKNIVHKMLFEGLNSQQMRKIDQVFDEIVYIPIKKYQNIYLKFQNKIQQNQQAENQQWQTDSQGKNEDQKEQQSPKNKKKSSKAQSNDLGNKKQSKHSQFQNEDQQDHQSVQNHDMQQDDSSLDDDQSIEEGDEQIDSDQQLNNDEANHDKIVQMFYAQGDKNIQKYKQLMILREQLNLSFHQKYFLLSDLQKVVNSDPQVQKKILKVVDILQNQITQDTITVQILNKLPQNLYKLLKNYGLTKQRVEEKVVNYRKEVTKMPRFINENLSQQDENSNNQDEQNYDQEAYDDADDLSEQSDSENDMFDGLGDQMLFVITEDGHLQHVNMGQLVGNQKQYKSDEQEQAESEQININQKLQNQADTFSLPQLKQINSKIQTELTGKQLYIEDIVKIMQICIVKLFSLHSYQLKQKPVLSFFEDIIKSQQGKIFIDTLFTVLRVDQLYTDENRLNLAKHLSKSQLSISRAINNMLDICIQITTEQSKQGEKLISLIKQQVRSLLPIGDQIVIKSDIPMQDNFLTLLVLYSRYAKSSTHQKLKKLLGHLNQSQKLYDLTRVKASLLTKHIYKNNNSSSIWNNLEQRFGVQIKPKIKFNSCLTVYGQLLREDVEKCYNDLLQIVNVPIEVHNEQEKMNAKLLIRQQQKKVQQNLRKHSKRIKHYYYWNKQNATNQIQKDSQQKPNDLLKNKELIKLTELMIFYCHFLKQRFFDKIDPSAMKNLLVLPKSIIQVSFIFLWKLEANIQKWQPLNKVKQYFKSFKLYEHKFNRLEEVCNLVLEFLQIPQFSNSKFKQVIIPYFINHPEIANQIPLIFKLPDIPEDLNGQKVYLTRQCSFDMSFYQLVAKSILVQFHNEEGSDHGGMVRQFMMGWSGLGVGQQYIFIGKILAISFKKSIPYGGDFDIGMAVAITQHKVTIQFLQQVDPEVAQSLKYIQTSDPQDLDLKFEITKQQFGIIKHYPLKQNGEQIPVTNQNKDEYIKLFLQKYFLVGRQWQISQVCTGFFSIVCKKYAAIFSPVEMIQKIQGEQISDYTKLKNKTKYEEGYTQSSQMIKWFWQIVSQFNQKQMNKFLQFITGAPKVSIYNHNFSFVIQKPYGEDEKRLPVAHTCFNTLQLPEYKTKEILQKKLIQAVYQGNDSFGIL